MTFYHRWNSIWCSGILIKIAEIAPPKTEPVYTPNIKHIAVSWVIVDVKPIKSAIAIVVDKPGSAPQMIPKDTPSKVVNNKNGFKIVIKIQ